ncbi:MAG: response regulator [Nitrospinales bacterium]
MKEQDKNFHILLVEDDDDDFKLIKDAFKEVSDCKKLHRAVNGDEAVNLILEYEKSSSNNPIFGLVILDLMMPKKNGFEVLKEIKSNPASLHIPVVVLSASTEKEQITKSYKLGANSVIKKPEKFQDLVEIMDSLSKYWLNTVKLPRSGKKN